MGHEGRVESGGSHRVEAVAQRGDELESHLRPVHLDRVRVEGDGDRVDAQLACPFDAGGDDLLVPVVHAVEVTDGHHGGLVTGDFREGMPDFHALSFLKDQDGSQAPSVDAHQAEDVASRVERRDR